MRSLLAAVVLALSALSAHAQSVLTLSSAPPATTGSITTTGYNLNVNTLFAPPSASLLAVTQPFTVVYGIKTTALNNNAQTFVDNRSGSPGAFGLGFFSINCVGCEAKAGYGIQTSVGTTVFHCDDTGATCFRPSLLNNGSWHTVCTSFQADRTRTQIDGAFVGGGGPFGGGTGTIPYTPPTTYWQIGNAIGTANQSVNLREYRVYNFALNPNQCTQLSLLAAANLKPTSGPLASNMALYLPMDACNGAVAGGGCNDSSGNGNNFTNDLAPPSISITAPSDGAVITGLSTFTVNASDLIGITSVTYNLNGVGVCTSTTAPFSCVNFDTSQYTDNTYVLTATASNVATEPATSLPISVTFSNGIGGNHYVRTSGNDTLCNGLVNVDYSGGVAPNCAWATVSRTRNPNGQTITGAVAGTGGVCRITVSSTAAYAANQQVSVTSVGGATACNGITRVSTVVDGTHLELSGTTFSGTYTSGGNVLTVYPAFSSIKLQGGQTFTDPLGFFFDGPSQSFPNAIGPLTVDNDGTGGTCLALGTNTGCPIVQISGTASSGAFVGSVPGMAFQNFRLFGNTANTNPCGSFNDEQGGLFFDNNVGQITGSYAVTNMEINGFSKEIYVKGASASGSFGTQVTNNWLHGTTTSSCDAVGVDVRILNFNFLISGNLVENMGGINGQNLLGGIEPRDGGGFGTIEFNVARTVGANNTGCGGPVGIETFDVNNILIQNNEAYANTFLSGCDGDGYDFDGGTVASTMQYNYSHGNKGNGVGMLAFGTTNHPTWGGNTARYNISENDGGSGSGSGLLVATAGGTITNSNTYAHNNTVFSSTGGFSGPPAFGTSKSIDATVVNNLFVHTSTAPFMVSCNPQPCATILDYNDYWVVGGGNPRWLWNTVTYSTFAAYKAGVGPTNEQHSLNVDPQLAGSPPFGTCYSSGIPAGPQPPPTGTCPNYQVNAGSPMIGVGLDLTQAPYNQNVGSQDYFGKPIPHSTGTGYNIGADGSDHIGTILQEVTNALIPASTLAGATQTIMCRVGHFTRSAVTSIQMIWPGWWANALTFGANQGSEVAIPAYTASSWVEYPIGTYTQVDNGITVASGVNTAGTPKTISIPTNTKFYTWRHGISGGTLPVFTTSGTVLFTDEACQSGTSGVPTAPSAVLPTDNHSRGLSFGPVAMVGPISATVVAYALGDSRTQGTADTADGTYDRGDLARSIGPTYNYINAGVAGDDPSMWLFGGANRRALKSYVTTIVSESNFNLFLNKNQTAANAANYYPWMQGFFAGKNFIRTTMEPWTTGTWTSPGGQTIPAEGAQVTSLNTTIRGDTSFVELRTPVEDGSNPGKWASPGGVAQTNDGIHPNPTGYQTIFGTASSVISAINAATVAGAMPSTNLTLTGSTSYDTTAQKFGTGALVLTSTGSFSLSGIGGGSFPMTVECWFKGTVAQNFGNIFGVGQGYLQTRTTGFAGVRQWGGASLNSSTTITDGSWHALAYVDTGAAQTLYVDGAVAASATTSENNAGLNTTGLFGGSFAYEIDECAYWNIAKYTSAYTPAAAPYVGNEAGLIAVWHFDQTPNGVSGPVLQ